jgi:hypothetical protein
VLNKNAMIRRYCQRGWMGLRGALVLFWVFQGSVNIRAFYGDLSQPTAIFREASDWALLK